MECCFVAHFSIKVESLNVVFGISGCQLDHNEGFILMLYDMTCFHMLYAVQWLNILRIQCVYAFNSSILSWQTTVVDNLLLLTHITQLLQHVIVWKQSSYLCLSRIFYFYGNTSLTIDQWRIDQTIVYSLVQTIV